MEKIFLAAVSGGPDSMALLELYKSQIKVVCHVNYHKRPDSTNDETIVKNYCEKNNIIFEKLDVTNEMMEEIDNNNFQAKARSIRYDFFVKMAKKYCLFEILMGHNLDDFIETAIMQKNRKSINYFYGIKRNNSYETLSIIRPLIKKTKKELEKFCTVNNVPYAVDSTNEDPIYERNKIRLKYKKKSKLFKLTKYRFIAIRNFFRGRHEIKSKTHFRKWFETNYSVYQFVDTPINYQVDVVYLYLKHFLIENVSKDKIKLVRDFILNKNNEDKKARIAENVYLVKNNRRILIER